MYGTPSIAEPNKCFCQICKQKVFRHYIEANDVEREPNYAWEQMYLSLCVKCSKDYILTRINPVAWKQFVSAIKSQSISSDGIYEIPIGRLTVTFTAVHLAEIQEILRIYDNLQKV